MSERSSQDPRADALVLVKAAAGGDRRAQEVLLGQLLPRARNLIRYLLRGDGEVDDIAQDALIAILRGLPGYRGEGSLTSWADRVVVRVTLCSLRKSRRERSLRDERPDLALLPDPSGRPDDYAARREMVRRLDLLPHEQRLALVLHHVVGMSVPEIAEHMGAPFETTRSRLRLGQASLRTRSTDGKDAGEET